MENRIEVWKQISLSFAGSSTPSRRVRGCRGAGAVALNVLFVGMMATSTGPSLAQPPAATPETGTANDLASVRIAREYRQCLIDASVRLGRQSTENAETIVRAAGAECQLNEGGSDRLFLLRTNMETEAFRFALARLNGGRPGMTSSQIRAAVADEFDRLIVRFDSVATLEVIRARTR